MRIRKALLSTSLLPLFLFSQGLADDSELRLFKTYAGETSFDLIQLETKRLDQSAGAVRIRREAQKNYDDKLTIPDRSSIPCEKGIQFGVVYLVGPRHLNYVSFDGTWSFPHLKETKPAGTANRNVVLRKDPSESFRQQVFLWKLANDELVDGEIKLMLRKGQRVLLEHTFEIRGCNPQN